MKKGGIPSPARPPRVKYCGEGKIGAGGKLVMKFDIVAPAGPSVVMYAIGCFRRAALDITCTHVALVASTAGCWHKVELVAWETKLSLRRGMASKITRRFCTLQ